MNNLSRGPAGGDRQPTTRCLSADKSLIPERCREYAVIGTYSDSALNFVRHLALLSREMDLPGEDRVEVWHVGPPLVAGEVSQMAAGATPKCRPDLASDVCLTIPEQQAIRNWLAKLDKERRPRAPFQQYVIFPHFRWERSEKGRRLYRRFSCGGFVLEAYDAAGLKILDFQSPLPRADEQTLRKAYPDLDRIERARPRIQAQLGFKGRRDLGLDGPDTWRIALPGYVFHSLRRATSATPRPAPYAPQDTSEAEFP